MAILAVQVHPKTDTEDVEVGQEKDQEKDAIVIEDLAVLDRDQDQDDIDQDQKIEIE